MDIDFSFLSFGDSDALDQVHRYHLFLCLRSVSLYSWGLRPQTPIRVKKRSSVTQGSTSSTKVTYAYYIEFGILLLQVNYSLGDERMAQLIPQVNAEIRDSKSATCASCKVDLFYTGIEVSIDTLLLDLCVNCATILADELVQCVEAEGDEE